MRRFCRSGFGFVMAAMLSGCGSDPKPSVGGAKPTGPSTPPPKTVIAISVLTTTNPFFKEIADVLTAEAAKDGREVVVASGDNDPLRQDKQVQDFLVRKVAAIVLTPCDSRAVGQTIRAANAAGVPVFTADIACLDKEAKVVCHVATDNFGGGRDAARAMIEALSDRGKVAILDFPEVESVIQRTKGFDAELADKKSKLQVVARLPGGGDREKSFKATQDLLQAHPDLTGIFAINDPSALGAIAALEKAGKQGQVKVVGFDGQRDGKVAIRAGKLYADPVQFPDEIARRTYAAIKSHLAGEDVPREVLIPTKLYRQADGKADKTLP